MANAELSVNGFVIAAIPKVHYLIADRDLAFFDQFIGVDQFSGSVVGFLLAGLCRWDVLCTGVLCLSRHGGWLHLILPGSRCQRNTGKLGANAVAGARTR